MVEVCPSFGNPLPHADIAAPAAAPIAVCIAGEQRSFYTIAESIQRTFVALREETDFYLALGGLTKEAARHARRVFSRIISAIASTRCRCSSSFDSFGSPLLSAAADEDGAANGDFELNASLVVRTSGRDAARRAASMAVAPPARRF